VNDEMPEPNDTGRDRLVGRVLAERYRIENLVSAGANTIIAEAIDTVDDVPVTLKIVRPERALHASFRDDFRRQVEIAQSLTHPNIVKVLDWGEVDIAGETTVFWVVEYLGGGSLRDLFDRGRLLEPSQALVVGLEACRALDAAHTKGIVHTELTPSKLVFGDDARLRIVDFAMAELLGAESWEEPATLATHVARYASPEQALRLEVDAKTDVYALSLCMIEAITGKVPFAGDSTVSTLSGRVGKLMPVTADMGSLAAVLERAGRPEGEDRWTAAEFAAALVQAAGTLPRPDPIPIMASSLFGASMLARQADRDVAVEDEQLPPTEPVDVAGTESVPAEDLPPTQPVDVADLPPTQPIDVADLPPTQPIVPVVALVAPPADAVTGIDAPPTTVMAAPPVAAPTQQMGVVEPAPYDDERRSRPWGKYAAIGLVVLIGIVALSVAGFLLLRTKSYVVPDLVGVDQAVALNQVAGNGWVIETNRERSDAVPTVDQVIRTIPAAGEKLDEGATFVVYVSDGPELRTIPELTGLALADAQATLTDLRLVLVEDAPAFSEDVPAGSIISWQVKDNPSLVAGAQVLPDTTIMVVVSQGPQPRPAPDLTNATFDEATATLAGVQLVIARGEDVFSSTVEAGRVVSQDPAPTTPVDRGGTVTVQVSKGPDLVPFPDLTGQTYPQAQATLAAAGFTEGSLLGTTQGTFVSASIGGAAVDPGATFPRGTAVDLIFL
jgi:eukaryotic-like serine/threonine-protein kinase